MENISKADNKERKTINKELKLYAILMLIGMFFPIFEWVIYANSITGSRLTNYLLFSIRHFNNIFLLFAVFVLIYASRREKLVSRPMQVFFVITTCCGVLYSGLYVYKCISIYNIGNFFDIFYKYDFTLFYCAATFVYAGILLVIKLVTKKAFYDHHKITRIFLIMLLVFWIILSMFVVAAMISDYGTELGGLAIFIVIVLLVVGNANKRKYYSANSSDEADLVINVDISDLYNK